MTTSPEALASFSLTESVATTLPITTEAAEALMAAGEQLASKSSWWGRGADGPGAAEEADDAARTVIRCVPAGSSWSVRVADAVGVVSVPGAQLVVHPKIPLPHFSYLFLRGAAGPRMDVGAALLAEGSSFWELLARWFVAQGDLVLRRGLLRDYEERREAIGVVRGHVIVMPTMRDLLRGRASVHCRYDDFVVDMPLNRLLREAARRIAGSIALPREVRRAADALKARLDEVGPLRPTDHGAATDRRSMHYASAVALAKQVIRNTHRELASGDSRAWTFLLRTPEAIELGIRVVLDEHLDGRVSKHGLQLKPSSHTLNPDLVFDDGSAIGDVKYKVVGSDWARADLYQAVAFATGFKASRAAVVSFALSEQPPPPTLQVGAVELRHFVWPTFAGSPSEAGASLAEDVEAWLEAGVEAATLAA